MELWISSWKSTKDLRLIAVHLCLPCPVGQARAARCAALLRQFRCPPWQEHQARASLAYTARKAAFCFLRLDTGGVHETRKNQLRVQLGSIQFRLRLITQKDLLVVWLFPNKATAWLSSVITGYMSTNSHPSFP
jgi:hypothetical protein